MPTRVTIGLGVVEAHAGDVTLGIEDALEGSTRDWQVTVSADSARPGAYDFHTVWNGIAELPASRSLVVSEVAADLREDGKSPLRGAAFDLMLLIKREKVVRDLQRLPTDYLGWIESRVKAFCAPVYFKDGEDLHTGSMTLVRSGTVFLGVTAGHVYDSLKRCCTSGTCQVGNGELRLDWLLGRHRDLDLAVFRLPEEFIASSGCQVAPIDPWPPQPICERDLVVVGGYPGQFTTETARRYEGSFVHFIGRVASVSERSAGMVLNIDGSVSLGSDRIKPGADLGGWSGGPLVRIVETDTPEGEFISRLSVIGIVYEAGQGFEIVAAHHLSSMRADGSFTP